MESIVDIRSIPSNVPVMCIPRVFSNIGEGRIRHVIQDLRIGPVEKIDIVKKQNDAGSKFNCVFVHLKYWAKTDQAQEARERLLQGKEIKIVYDEPWFWKVSAYRQSQPKQHHHRNSKYSDKRQRRHPTIVLDDDDDDDDVSEMSYESRERQDNRSSRSRSYERQDNSGSRPRYDYAPRHNKQGMVYRPKQVKHEERHEEHREESHEAVEYQPRTPPPVEGEEVEELHGQLTLSVPKVTPLSNRHKKTP